jgi:succinate-acetate transporter protein
MFAPAGLEADAISMGYYLSVWGIFTGFMYIGTLTHNKATQVVFLSLTVLFALLAIGDFTGSSLIKTIAGYEGLFCGASAFYSAVAQIVNGEHKKTIFPL